MKVTIYDVAREANVSIATVSKVINNSGRISDETRKHVLKVINELNYQPNMIASALTGKKTNSIGLLIPDLANPFFSELARSIEDRGHLLNYQLIICSTDYSPEKELEYIQLLKRKNVDGIIIASGFEQVEVIEKLVTKEQIPMAIVARNLPFSNINTVSNDDYYGGFLATKHLIQLNHKKIAIIARDVWTNRERMKGYEKALKDAQIDYQFPFEFIKESTIEWGKKMTTKYLNSDLPPTAIFACNDMLAIGAIQAIKELGLLIPEDISVVGFDDSIMSTVVDPPLTTIRQPVKSMGENVISLIDREIRQGVTEKSKLILTPKLIQRSSTKIFTERDINSN